MLATILEGMIPTIFVKSAVLLPIMRIVGVVEVKVAQTVKN